MDGMSEKTFPADETTESSPELRSMPILSRNTSLSRRSVSGPKDPSMCFPSFVDSASDISDEDSDYECADGDKDDAESIGEGNDRKVKLLTDLNENSLPVAPLYIAPNANCIALSYSFSTIAERITNFLRAKSITNSVHPGESEVRMDCCTDSLLCFAIFLWRNPQEELVVQHCMLSPIEPSRFMISASDTPSKHQDMNTTSTKVLVELQRRRGCSILMGYVKRALFLSIQNGVIPNNESLRPRFLGKIPRRIVEKYSVDSSCKMKAVERQALECKEAFSQSYNLLKSGYKDQNRLGLENFVLLTNPSSSVNFPREKLARALVFGEGNAAPYIRHALLTYVGSASQNNSQNARFNYHVSEDEEYTRVNAMKNLALKLLVNSLDLVMNSKQGDVSTSAEEILCSRFWDSLLQAFHDHIRRASIFPQEAALSAKCLSLLSKIFPHGYSTIFASRYSVYKNVLKAKEFGKRHHFLLEQESQKLLEVLH